MVRRSESQIPVKLGVTVGGLLRGRGLSISLRRSDSVSRRLGLSGLWVYRASDIVDGGDHFGAGVVCEP